MTLTQSRLRLEWPLEALTDFCRRHHIRRLSVFGSTLRDDFTPQGDVDFLVEFEPGTRVGAIRLAALESKLTTLIGQKADLNPAGPFRNGVFAPVPEEETLYVLP